MGVRRKRHARADPADRPLTRRLFEQVEALLDRRLLLLGRHAVHRLVLKVSMPRDVMSGLGDLRDRFGIDLAAAAVDAERAADVVLFEEIDQAINADLAAVTAPGDAGEIDDAGLGRGRLDAVRRRLALGPGLKHHTYGDADALAVRPMKVFRQFFLPLQIRLLLLLDAGFVDDLAPAVAFRAHSFC